MTFLFDGKWQKEFTEDGVTVWSRNIEGTKVIQVKAFTVVNQNPDVIWRGLQEDGKFMKCMPNVIIKKDFEKCGENCKLTFQKIHRAPLKDRTYVIKVTWTRKEENGKIIIHHVYKQVKGHKMATQNGMEVDNIFGRWELVSEDGKTTKFTYINHVDLGGLVPASLVNKSLKENAAKFLKNLKAQAPSWK